MGHMISCAASYTTREKHDEIYDSMTCILTLSHVRPARDGLAGFIHGEKIRHVMSPPSPSPVEHRISIETGLPMPPFVRGGLTRNVGGHKHPRQRGALEEAQQQEYDRTVGQTHRHPQQAGQAGGHEEAAPTTQPENTRHVELHHSKHKHARARRCMQFEFRLVNSAQTGSSCCDIVFAFFFLALNLRLACLPMLMLVLTLVHKVLAVVIQFVMEISWEFRFEAAGRVGNEDAYSRRLVCQTMAH